jgi:signal peptidase I
VKTEERGAPAADGRDGAGPEPGKKKRNGFVQFLGEVPGLILMALILAIVIKTFVVQAFYIPSPSMVPTLRKDDRVLVTRIPYYFGEPTLGDVVVFEDPDPSTPPPDRGVFGGALHWVSQKLGVEQPDNEDFIKRVIGTPGDVVTVKKGQLYVNGRAIDEPYVQGTTEWPTGLGKITVPEGMLFVMGDNRENSMDSRFGLGVRDEEQGVGFVPIDKVIGKAFVIVWPPDHWGGLSGPGAASQGVS